MKKFLLFLMFALFCIPWAANAQTIVEIGNGTSSQNYPLPGYYGYQYDVFLYSPSNVPELGVSSDISSIAFKVNSNNTNSGAKMYIWVKDVNADYALASATTFADYISGATQVYVDEDFSSTTGWNTFDFSSTFSHDGSKALLVAVRGVGCGTSGGCSRSCYYTSVSNTYWYQRQDGSDPGQNVAGTLSNNRANIQLNLTYTGEVCFAPTGLTSSNVTESAATLSWTESGNSTAWVLEYGTASDYSDATTVNVSGTPTTSLSGLSALTTYYVRVMADCGSNWLTGSFTTSAVAEPVGTSWSDDFDGNLGWELINGSCTNVWVHGNAANNGGQALYISNDGGASNAYTNNSAAVVYATKLLGFEQGKYEFSYDWLCNGESTYDYMRVALVPASVTLTAGTSLPSGLTTSAVPTGWIALDGGGKLNLSTAWQGNSVAVTLTGGNYYLVFVWRDDTSQGSNPPAAVDNVSITKIACDQDVTNLAVSDITTTGANLAWEGGEASQWQVVYSTDASFENVTEEIVSTDSYYMTGLQPSTVYYVKVRAYCGGEDFGSWSSVLNFPTACELYTDYPYTENFDSYEVASSYTAPSTRMLPTCWYGINTTTYSSYSAFPTMYYYSTTNYANSTPNCLKLYSYYYNSSYTNYDPQPQYAVLPAMADLNGKQLTLNVRGYNTSSTFKVGLMTDPMDASTFTEIATQEGLTTSYQEFIYDIEGEGEYIAIMIEAANSSRNYNGIYVDDITVADPPTCEKPQGLTVSEITAHTAQLTWESEATAWQICINDDEDNLIDVDETPYILEGLDGSTTYTVRVRANCGNDGMSLWTANKSFTTAVACPKPTSLTKTELTAHSAKLGWTENGQASEWVIAYKVTADAEFIEVPVNENPYTLYGLEPSTGYTFKVKAVCGGIDGESEYSTTTTFTTTTECPAPTNLVCEGATTTTATLGWFGGENDMWELLVLQGTDTIYDYIIEPEPSYTVEDLLPGTTYTFKVRTYCGESWSSTQTFTTAFSIPFVEPFATTSAPAGWTRYSGLLSDVMGGTALSTISSGWNFGTGNGVMDTHAKVNIYSTSCKYWLVTPPVLMDENVQLTFDLALTKYSGTLQPVVDTLQQDDKFVVLITTNGGTSWEILRQWDNAGSEYVYNNITCSAEGEEVTIDLSNYANSEYIAIAFYGESTVSGGDNNLHVDNVKINYIPTCNKPTGLAVSEVTAHTATLSWTSEDGQAWNIYVEENGDELNGGVNVTENPYTLTGLTAESSYVVKVRTDCGNDGVSEWSNEVSFTTPVACPAPTNVAVEYNGGTTATVTWEGPADGSFLLYLYGGSPVVDPIPVTSPYTLEGLELATNYTVQLITDCTADNEGWSDTANSVVFTTDFCLPADMCEITFELTDNYGDGWNGNAIKVVDVQTGTVLGQFANTNVAEAGEAQTYTLAVCDGREISFEWVSGSYAYEASYAVYDLNGEEIFSGEDAMSAAVTYMVDCTVPTCPKPKNLAYTVNADGVTINWTGESDNYNVQLGVNDPEILGTVDFEDQVIPQMCENDSLYPWTVVAGHGGYYIQSGNAGVSNSTSAISFIGELEADGAIEFDALCMGEGSSTFWDHCDFYIDEERVLYAGANIANWNHYKFEVPAGEHTFLWSYTKDGTQNPSGDLFAIDNVTLSLPNIVWNDAEAATGTSHDFAISEAGEYCVKVQSDCGDEVSEWSNTLYFDYTPTTCVIVLNEENGYTWFQNFESLTSVTTPVTEVQPACWTWNRLVELPEDYADTLPHLYYKSAFAHSGDYSLRLWNRGVYAMPMLDESININQVKMSFYNRHSYSFYTLLVGVMTDPTDPTTFEPVAYVDNGVSTYVKYFEFDFSNYQGEGRYIAFKNVRPTASSYDGDWNDVHSVNYIDDITLTLMEPGDCTLDIPYAENFDGMTSVTNKLTGATPECWEVVARDVENIPFDKLPQLYYSYSLAYNGYYSLRMADRCVYAMPNVTNYAIQDLHLSMRVRQPNEKYQLQVGIWEENEDGTGTFVPVALANNSTTNYELFECDFDNYDGPGTRIAFRNTLNGGMTWDYSYNYIDNINIETRGITCESGNLGTETFDNFTTSTVPATGVKPTCWDVVAKDVQMAYDKYPQVYYNADFANSGSYTLRLADRCVFAMPELWGYDIAQLSLSMYLRQPNENYQLEVGIWEMGWDEYQNPIGEFIPIATFNNETTDVTYVECDFSSYSGNGYGRIAFRNTLAEGKTWNYSYNYLDDVTITTTEVKNSNASNENLIDEMGVERYLESIAIYPNPTVGELHIGAVDVQKVECYNQMGQLVAVYNNDRDINISALADGVYTLRITVPQGVTMRKVVKR